MGTSTPIAKIKDEQQQTTMVNGASGSGMGGNGSNASNANGANASGAENNGGTFADQNNPFLAMREAQRMMKNYPDDELGRQSLEQLNEISRRATVAGMSFSNANANGRPGTPARMLAGLVAQGQQTVER